MNSPSVLSSSTSATSTPSGFTESHKTLAIIGAGPSGLSALSYFLSQGVNVTCYDSRSGVGGVWNTSADPGLSTLKSPIYHSLRTQTPAETIGFSGVHFPEGTEQFPHNTVVLQYLQSFAVSQDLYPHILLRHPVISLSFSTSSLKWKLVSSPFDADGRQLETKEAEYDHVLVATGHYSVPYVPSIPGLESFKGRVIPAKEWRGATEEGVIGEKVLVVGGGASGNDIVRQILKEYKEHHSEEQKEVFQSLRSCSISEKIGNLTLIPRISHISSTGIHFSASSSSDGALEGITLIIFATGYEYSFPFLNADQEPFKSSPLLVHGEGEKNRLANLDEMGLVYLPQPTLGFLSLQNNVISFLLAPLQAKALHALWYSSPEHPIHLSPLPISHEAHKSMYYDDVSEPVYYRDIVKTYLSGREREETLAMIEREKWRWDIRRAVAQGWITRRD
ncbi:FAD/NAD(P)-binding domain-containing protein [Atractiella rhizophila]|nr:FAD/NAD(P)-binding domain-containing protein [Atractiella rhizophila]